MSLHLARFLEEKLKIMRFQSEISPHKVPKNKNVLKIPNNRIFRVFKLFILKSKSKTIFGT